MSDPEIRRGIDRIIEQLRAEVATLTADRARFEQLADRYWQQLVAMTRERDALQTELNNLKALACSHPACQLCQIG